MVIHVWSLHSQRISYQSPSTKDPTVTDSSGSKLGPRRSVRSTTSSQAPGCKWMVQICRHACTNLCAKCWSIQLQHFQTSQKWYLNKKVSHEISWTMALSWMAAIVNHVVLRPSFLHEFHGPRKPRNPNLLDKFICLISHHGSMVLVYMVCHGSHHFLPQSC